jgi:hypothetical protein
MRTRLSVALLAVAALAGAAPARADVVQASSTTMVQAYPSWVNGAKLTVVPFYELLSITAYDIKTPLAESLELGLSTWGAVNAGDNPWWNGYANSGSLSGDVNLAWVRAAWLRKSIVLTLGRTTVAAGNARMLQLDGGSVAFKLPAGFSLSGYGGAPVSARFSGLGGYGSSNPSQGNLAFGGRAGWNLPGVLDVGISYAGVQDRGYPSRQDLAGDLRLTPLRWLSLMGYLDYSLYGKAVASASANALFLVSHAISVSVDYQYTVPSLFLAADSILSVFSNSNRNDIAANLHLALGKFAVDVGGAVLLSSAAITAPGDPVGYPFPTSPSVTDNGTGWRATARGTWRPTSNSSLGAEVTYLDVPENSYFNGRIFGSLGLGRFTGTVDLQDYYYGNPVNGQRNSFLGGLTVGYLIGAGWSAVVAGNAGVTPYFSSELSGMLKITYNQTYVSREVRP